MLSVQPVEGENPLKRRDISELLEMAGAEELDIETALDLYEILTGKYDICVYTKDFRREITQTLGRLQDRIMEFLAGLDNRSLMSMSMQKLPIEFEIFILHQLSDRHGKLKADTKNGDPTLMQEVATHMNPLRERIKKSLEV